MQKLSKYIFGSVFLFSAICSCSKSGSGGSSATATASSSACVSNTNPTFTNAIINPADTLVVIPPGLLTAVEPKGHSYIRSNLASASTPVYAPVDMKLKKFIYYDSYVSNGVGGTYAVYLLDFEISCEVRMWIDHLYSPVSAISSLAPGSPSPSTASIYEVSTNLSFQAGDLIGYAQPYEFDATKSQIDMGVRNTASSNTFANTSVLPDKVRYSECPYQYFTTSLKNQYEALYGDSAPVAGGTCRSVASDVVGSISGLWYSSLGSGTGSGIFDGYLGISLRVDTTKFFIGGLKSGEFVGNLGGSPAPASVTVGGEVCYSDGSSHVYFKLLSNTQLQVAFKDGDNVCPGSFPATSTGYDIYETYTR